MPTAHCTGGPMSVVYRSPSWTNLTGSAPSRRRPPPPSATCVTRWPARWPRPPARLGSGFCACNRHDKWGGCSSNVAPGWGKWTTPFAWPYVLMICVRIVPVLLAIAFLLPSTAAAAHRPNDDPATAACIREAAQRFQVPELALWVLLDVEAGKLGQVSTNTNGTYDI